MRSTYPEGPEPALGTTAKAEDDDDDDDDDDDGESSGKRGGGVSCIRLFGG
jgi:hypothetical protein